MQKVRPPLSVYVAWHHKFVEGLHLAEKIFQFFNRDIKDSLSRGIGIPVFYRSGEKMRAISSDESDYTTVILLVDPNMVIDAQWNKYIDELIVEHVTNPRKYMIYPVAIEKNAINLRNSLPKKNFIRAYEHNNEWNYISSILAHEFCRLLYDLKRIDESSQYEASPPLKLFISHAKTDGVQFAKSLCTYIQGETPLKTFFDANDIAIGYDFPQEIEAHIDHSVFIVIHTDRYSSREWCRREVVLAKRHDRPIVLINIIAEGEDRSFPYMANVKTIRVNQSDNASETNAKTILFILRETLRFQYQRLLINYLVRQFSIQESESVIFSYPPELLTIMSGDVRNKKYVIYPDPPLSREEIDILDLAGYQLQYITPALIPTMSEKRMVVDSIRKIGLSVSEVDDSHHKGYGDMHLQDAMVELSKYLLVNGFQLAYGGNVRYIEKFNFAELLFDLVRSYNKANLKPVERIDNYLAYPIYHSIQPSESADLNLLANLIHVAPPMSVDKEPEEVMKCLTIEDQVIWARSLTNMRLLMNENISARVIIGGKTQGFKGMYPGVIEEAYIALKSQTPMYVIGGFGGAAEAITEALEGRQPSSMTKEFHVTNSGYNSFLELFNAEAHNNEYEEIDYEKLVQFFNAKKTDGLHNGLNPDENHMLFHSTNIIEIISLIYTGMGRLFATRT